MSAKYPCFSENGVIKTTAAGYAAIKAELERSGVAQTGGPIGWSGCRIIVVSDEEIAALEARARRESKLRGRAMTRRASPAQARRLAVLFGDERKERVPHGGAYYAPTIRALIDNGWMEPTGAGGTWPSGAAYDDYQISPAGLRALEDHLRAAREKREAP